MRSGLPGRFGSGFGPAQAAMLVVLAAGCSKDDRKVCTSIGREGGVLQSYDTVLSIALQPEALDETSELCITPTDAPPDIFGEAYLVDPPLRLNYDAVVSYRGALPDNLSDVNVGRISDRDFMSGSGKWVSLTGCRVEEDARNVQCTDKELSKFYGLLNRIVGDSTDTIADTGSETSDPTTGSSVSMTTDDTATTGPQGIDYPPECDDLFRGPFEAVSQGDVFEEGPEDMAADGQGGFVARSGSRFVRLDVTGGTLGTPNDPGFTVSELVDSPLLDGLTLGIRYAPSGDLIFASGDDGMLRSMTPDGSLSTLVDGLAVPNGVFVDADNMVWYTEFSASQVWRLDLAREGAAPVAIGNAPMANGIYYDPRRQMAFFPAFETSELFGVAIADDGTPGMPVLITELGGTIDGLAMDVCGNLYAVDNDGPARLIRVFMTDTGELTEMEDIATGLGDQANASFGVGAAYGPFSTAIFLTGLAGEVDYVDVQITGADVPGLSAPPATVDDPPDTTGTDGDSGSSSGSSTG